MRAAVRSVIVGSMTINVVPATLLLVIGVGCSGSVESSARETAAHDSGAEIDTVATDADETDTADSGPPACRSERPITADWCVLTGTVAERGAVRVDGPVVPIEFQPADEAFAIQVPLGVGPDDPVLEVTTLDADGEVTSEERIAIARGDRTGDVQMIVTVVDEEGNRIEGAEMTIAGRTFTTDDEGSNVIVGTVEWAQEDGRPFVVDGVAAGTDLVHVTADGYLGRLESIAAWEAGQPVERFPADLGYELRYIEVTLEPVADPITVRRGDPTVALSDQVRIEFGPDGAPENTEVSLTEDPTAGSALQPFGVGLFDISPVELGPGASLRLAIGDDLPDDIEIPDEIEITLWEPTTATRRDVAAEVDVDAGELVVPLDEIHGEIVYVSQEFTVVRTDHGPFGDPVDEELWNTSPPCGEDLGGDFTIAPFVEWRPEFTSDGLENLLRRHGIVDEVQGAQPRLTIPAGHRVTEPVFIRKWIHRVEYNIIYHYSDFDAVLFELGGLPVSDSYERLELGAAVLVSGDDDPPAVEAFEPVDDCAIVGTWRRVEYHDFAAPYWGPGGAWAVAEVITIEADWNISGEVERYHYTSDKGDCEDVFVLTVHAPHPHPGDVYREEMESTTCNYFEYFLDFDYELELVEWQVSADGRLWRAEVGQFGRLYGDSIEEYEGVSIWERR